MQKQKQQQSGFTLIELLIVIAIIGILASVVLVSLSSTRDKARDTERRQDIRGIMTALEMHYHDNGTYALTGYGQSGGGGGWFSWDYGSAGTSIVEGMIDGGYFDLATYPHDPDGNTNPALIDTDGDDYMIYLAHSGQVGCVVAKLTEATSADDDSVTRARAMGIQNYPFDTANMNVAVCGDQR